MSPNLRLMVNENQCRSPVVRSVAVVGCGAAGIATAWAIRQRAPVAIHVFDPEISTSRRGMGLPYGPDPMQPLLNAPLRYMSVVPGDDGHCERWFRSRRGAAPELPVSRPAYGVYLRDALDELIATGAVTPRQSRVHAVYEDSRGFRLASSHSELGTFDAVVLCTGWATNASGGAATPLEQLAETVAGLDEVDVLGCGLTALDAVRVILRESDAAVTMMSRRGLLPTVRQLAAPTELRAFTADAVESVPTFGLRELFSGLVREGVASGIDVEPLTASALGTDPRRWIQDGLDAQRSPTWRGLVVLLSEEVMRPAWARISSREKRLFLTRFHVVTQAVCNPMPGTVAEELAQAMDDGRLSVERAGRRGRRRARGAATTVDCRRDGHRDLADVDAPIVRSLVHQGLAVRDPFGGVTVSPRTNRLVAAGPPRQLFAVGALAQGSCYVVNAVDAIVRQASVVAAELDRLGRPRAAERRERPCGAVV